MKIKNSLILALSTNGIANTTNHEVPAKDAYKAFKFKNGIAKATEEIEKKREGLVKEAGIEDAKKFEDRRRELEAVASPTEEQKQELADLNAQFDKFRELWDELLKDETDVEGVKTMSFESYHALSRENRQTRVQVASGEKDSEGNPKMTTVLFDLFQVFMGELENILWKAPDDEE